MEPTKGRKPEVFIGSSKEALEIAYAIQYNLEEDADTTIWDQEVFTLGGHTLGSLITQLDKFDFGVFVLSPDDTSIVRGKEYSSPRDNVLFELGLFIGRLGSGRSFYVVPRNAPGLRLPSDLDGITSAKYDPERIERAASAALGSACALIKKAIRELGVMNREHSESFSALEANLGTHQRSILDEIRIRYLDLNAPVSQAEIERICKRVIPGRTQSEIFYRLRDLCSDGFLDSRISGKAGPYHRHAYSLSDAYQAYLRTKL